MLERRTVSRRPRAAALDTLWRRTGADLPFGDPGRAHGVGMEGWYVRAAQPATGRVVAVMVGVVRERDGRRWAHVNVAVHPEGLVRTVVVDEAVHAGRLVHAGGTIALTHRSLHAAVDDVAVELRLGAVTRLHPALWGALGPAHLLPWLPQYWTPTVGGAAARGHLEVGGVRHDLAGASVYAEKNWGASFPGRGWWWGSAHAFAGHPGLVAAFAGGPLGPLGPSPTALLVAGPGRLVRLGTPLVSPVTAALGEGTWSLRGGDLGRRVRIEGTATASDVELPHPEAPGRAPGTRARQELAGRLELALERRRAGRWRTEIADRSGLAGLERGAPDP